MKCGTCGLDLGAGIECPACLGVYDDPGPEPEPEYLPPTPPPPLFDQRPLHFDNVHGFTVSGWLLLAIDPQDGKIFRFDITDSLPTPQEMEEFREEAACLWEAAGRADNENEDDSEPTTPPARRGNEPKGPK